MEFYEVKVRYQREIGDGKLKKANETYLIEAVSYADAETRILEEIKPFVFGGMEIKMPAIKIVSYNEVLPNPQGQFWYKAKVTLTTVDEEAGKEKKITTYILVQESSIDGVTTAVNNLMKNAITDYSITNIQETNIMDVLSLIKNAK